jgi:DnaJ-class molecular chaperone
MTPTSPEIDNEGLAWKAGIDIKVTDDDAPTHASPVWENRQTKACAACEGYGCPDEEYNECKSCLGSGVEDDR